MWKQALRSLPVGVLILDERKALCYANVHALEVLQKDWSELRDRVCSWSDVESLSDSEEESTSVFQIQDVKTEQTVHATVVPFADECRSELQGYSVCWLRDDHEVEALRREHEKLLQLATLNDMLPTILHELRNPLAAIESVVQLLIEESNESISMDLHAILMEVRRMSLTLHGIGSVGKNLRSKKHHAIDYHIEDVIRIMNRTASKTRVSVVSKVALMPLLPLSPSVLDAIAFNLISNAIQACSPGGRVVVQADLIDKTLFQLKVIDTGKGMSPHVLKHCTELFYSTKPRGTGVGLALCSRTVEAAGGTFWVESEEGVGTTITVSLPLTGENRGSAAS
ncbi:MAG: HAMP domain-containing histidine kinase [Deltaproteobacteria bacterium]|nr:MAG: HAMP domain-containing histidine kinase [Deltaproteobacteria bacterium]